MIQKILSPLEVLTSILESPYDIDHVRSLTTTDVTYVFLNYDNPKLKLVMPWCGTSRGPEAIVQTFVKVARFWSIEAFQTQVAFGDREHAAMFGSFTYRSIVLGKAVTSPFSAFAAVKNGKCTYLQFLEDTFATANSFRAHGEWTIHSDPAGDALSV